MNDGFGSNPQTLVGSAAVACAACRKLKMRCVGAENPPCIRCTRARRECVVLLPRRGQQRRQRHVASTSPPATATREAVKADNKDETSVIAIDHTNIASSGLIDSTFIQRPNSASATPHSSTNLSDNLFSNQNQLFSDGSRSTSSPSNTSISRDGRVDSPDDLRHADVPEKVLYDLVHFFRIRLLFFVPLIGESELDDMSAVLQEKRCLAECAAFVATTYAPGAAVYRSALALRVAAFLKQLNGPLETDEQKSWTQLQAYATLYAYMPSSDVPYPSAYSELHNHLDHWTLKSDIERFASRHGVHRAVDTVKSAIEEGIFNLVDTPACRRYVYWLWLFTMSYHFSLCTGTPPTIKPDSTIKAACRILNQVPKPPNVTRTLAEVDLYMLWNAADLQLSGLAEWWCAPIDSPDLKYAMHVLDDAEAALEVWSRRWGLHGEPNTTYPDVDVPRNGSTAFHFHSTVFFLHTFATRMIHPRLLSRSRNDHLSEIHQSCARLVLRSARAAENCCLWFINLSPMKKDVARYMADFGFAMIVYCGLYLIRIHNLMNACYPQTIEFIHTAEQCARVIIDMSSATHRVPALYGQQILDQLALLGSRSEREHDGVRTTLSPSPFSSTVQTPFNLRNPLTWIDDTLRIADETLRMIFCQP